MTAAPSTAFVRRVLVAPSGFKESLGVTEVIGDFGFRRHAVLGKPRQLGQQLDQPLDFRSRNLLLRHVFLTMLMRFSERHGKFWT